MASRANQHVLLGCGLLCAAALLCTPAIAPSAAEAPPPNPAPAGPAAALDFPIASDARLAGDGKQTRFVLDLDKTIQFRAFTLADPYRVIIDIPQVSFKLPAGRFRILLRRKKRWQAKPNLGGVPLPLKLLTSYASIPTT